MKPDANLELGGIPDPVSGLMAARRAQLAMFLEESKLNGMLEGHLLAALADVRAARGKADGFVAAIIADGERRPYTVVQWQVLLGGIEKDVAAACTRHSVRMGEVKP